MAANECTVSLTLTVTPFFGTFLFFSSFEKSVGRRMRIEREWSGVVGNLDCRFIIYKQTTSRGNKKEWPILPGNS